MLTFAAPAFLWGLLALGVVALLHQVRVRRQRREVAGLFLWRRAREAGARRPRFRAGLLLLLQLLAVTFLVLALARPLWGTTGPGTAVLVVDASASMLARDGAGSAAAERLSGLAPDATRLEVAKRVAAELASEAGRVAVVRAGRSARLALPPSDDAGDAPAALASLEAGDDRHDAERALILARDVIAAEEAAGHPTELHWLSDAPPPSSAGVRIHPLAGNGTNVGITGFERVARQAWVRLTSTAPRPLEIPLSLHQGEREVARSTVVVPAGGDTSLTFPVGQGGGALEARIATPTSDVLALDDVAFAGSPEVRVGLERPFAALERALGAIDDVRTVVGPVARTGRFDLRILTESPEGLAALAGAPGPEGAEAPADGARSALAGLPGGAAVLLPPREASAVAASVSDWDAGDPMFRFVDLSELVVALVPAAAADGPGWTTLVRGVPRTAEAPAEEEGGGDAPAAEENGATPQAVPLLQRASREAGPVWRFAFHPVRGDLTLRPAFPTWVVNLVDLVRREARVPLGATLPAGASREGTPTEVADRPGLYRAEGRTLHASLLNEDESRLPAPGAFPAEATPEEQGPDRSLAGAARALRPLAPWLAGVALLVLLAEWWLFSGARVGLPFRRSDA